MIWASQRRSPGYGGAVNSSIESLIVRIGLPAGQRRGRGAVVAGWVIAAALPLIGLVSLLWRSELDVRVEHARIHFTLLLAVSAVDFVLAYAAGVAAERRGDARVLLICWHFWRPADSSVFTRSEHRASCSTRRWRASRWRFLSAAS
jgi:hypothetical protein